MQVHHRYAEPWRATLVDTGEETMTGGRLVLLRYARSKRVVMPNTRTLASDVAVQGVLKHRIALDQLGNAGVE
jgi:hypothetical protein